MEALGARLERGMVIRQAASCCKTSIIVKLSDLFCCFLVGYGKIGALSYNFHLFFFSNVALSKAVL